MISWPFIFRMATYHHFDVMVLRIRIQDDISGKVLHKDSIDY
jgi:hypothetical protein